MSPLPMLLITALTHFERIHIQYEKSKTLIGSLSRNINQGYSRMKIQTEAPLHRFLLWDATLKMHSDKMHNETGMVCVGEGKNTHLEPYVQQIGLRTRISGKELLSTPIKQRTMNSAAEFDLHRVWVFFCIKNVMISDKLVNSF